MCGYERNVYYDGNGYGKHSPGVQSVPFEIWYPVRRRTEAVTPEIRFVRIQDVIDIRVRQYRLYENGEIPNVANGRVLRSIQSPYSFETFVDAARNVLSEKDYESIRQKISELKKTQYTQEYFVKKSIFGDAIRNKFNGYAKQSVSKLKNVILFFINKFNGVYTTQMNKLLFYIDFASYRNFGEGMTGLAYKAIQFGPVPDRWDKVYSLIDDIHPEIIDFGNGNAGTKLMSDIQYDESCFNEEQLDLLNDVYMTFKCNIAVKLEPQRAGMDGKSGDAFVH